MLYINFLRALVISSPSSIFTSCCCCCCWGRGCGGLLTKFGLYRCYSDPSLIFKLTFMGWERLFWVYGLLCWPPPRWLVIWSGIVNSKLSNFSCWLGVARYVSRLFPVFPGAWWIGRMKSRFMSLAFLGFGWLARDVGAFIASMVRRNLLPVPVLPRAFFLSLGMIVEP